MSIKRAVIIYSLIVVVGILGLLIVSSKLIISNNEVNEQQQMKSEMLRFQADLGQQLNDFGSFVGDWAAWDDPYNFVKKYDEQFLLDNVTLESMQSANISMMVFLDATGKIVFSKEINQETLTEEPLSESITHMIVSQNHDFIYSNKDESKKGILMDENVVTMVAAYPLIGNSREEPIIGTLVMGRKYSSKLIDLGNKNYLKNALYAVTDELPLIPSDYRANALKGEVVVVPVSNEVVQAYQTVLDMNHSYSILMKVEQPRTIVQQNKKILHSYGVIVISLVGLFSILLSIASDYVVARPLVLLRKELLALMEQSDYRGRVRVTGLKEHQDVSLGINHLMEKNQQLTQVALDNAEILQQQLAEIEQNSNEQTRTKQAMMNILEDQKELEDELRQEKEQVEKKVLERTRELSEEQAKLKGSIDSLPVGYLMIDKEGNPVMVNKSVNKLFPEMSITQVVELVREWIKGQHEVKLDLVGGLPMESLMMGGVAHNNGYVDLSVVPIQVEQERIGWVILISDVTEAKNLQKSRDEFFSIASHELRTPLTAIRGNTALIRDYYPELMKDESVHQIMDDIHGAAVRLISIVNDFLDASRLELKKIEFKIEPFDIVKLITKVVEANEPSAKEKQIGWNLNLNDIHEHFVSGDMARAEQILYNLMGNAMKFTKEGSVTMELKLIQGGAEVWVTDTGLGIPAENQRKLFRKFQQAGESVFTREASQGSGMGLYISKLLAEGMNGTIRLESSTLGKGSTFVFRLTDNT